MTTPSDEMLVHASREGDRAAFATLVTRYRDVVVGVAYNRLGEFNSSEDIAQQTFVTAWNRKLDLSEPSKIAAWLCGIARNLVLNERRRIAREPAKSVDERTPSPSTASPLELSIEREEDEMLWKVLATIPESFREPMILYYREQATTADVASALNVTEDVVRQRLSRGRKLLEAKVADYIEQTLTKRRTSPGFNAAVLAMLPASTASKSTGVLAAIGAKLIFGFGAVLGPLLGLAGAVYGSKRSLDGATSATERQYLWKLIWMIAFLVVGLLAFQLGLQFWLSEWKGKPIAQGLLWGLYAIFLSAVIARGNQQLKRIKLNHGMDEERAELRRFDDCQTLPGRATWNLIGALTGSVSWMIVLAAIERDWIGLVLVSTLLLGVLMVFLPRIRRAATASLRSRASWQAVLAIVVGTVLIVAARWSVWSNQLIPNI